MNMYIHFIILSWSYLSGIVLLVVQIRLPSFSRLYYCLKEVSLLLFSLKNGVVFVSFFIAGQRHP